MLNFDVKFTYFWLLIIEVTKCLAILTGNEAKIQEDITSLPKYGCQWYGGSSAMVKCTCREDAEEFTIRRGDIPVYDTWTVEINNCKNVTFEEHSIEDLRNLRNLNLNNIGILNLEQESLNWFGYRPTYQPEDEQDEENIPSLRINIENSNIKSISQHAFKGRIAEIHLQNCRINEIESFAFTLLKHTRTVTMGNTVISNVKPQAFKSFSTKQLILDNVTIDVLPSRLFSNIRVSENLIVKNSQFGTVYSGAFIIDAPKWFEVTNSNITTLDGEAFTVSVKGDVHFKNNRIGVVNSGAFIKITPSRDLVTNTALYLIVDGNYFSDLGRNSLDVQDIILKLVDLKLNESCNCEVLTSRLEKFKESFSEIQCLDERSYVSLNDYKNSKCTVLAGHTTMIVIICVICVLLLSVIVFLSLYYHKAYREGRYGSGKQAEPTKNMSLIVPDGRTYRETEVHVILERVDLLTTDL